jgi:hypothetical protein
MHELFRDSHPILGSIPGPLAFAEADDVVWVCGGGRGRSAVLRFGPDGWHRIRVAAHGLRAILPLAPDRAIVVGEYGFAAYVFADPERDADMIDVPAKACLFAVARAGDGRIVAGGDGGPMYAIQGTSAEIRRTGTTDRVAHIVADGDTWLWAGTSGLYRAVENGYSTRLLDTSAALTRIARAPDGTLALSGDGGQLWFVRGEDVVRVDSGVTLDLETIAWDPAAARFVIGGARGTLLALATDGTVSPLATFDPERSVTAVLPCRGGVLAGGWKQTGAPYSFAGDDPPLAVRLPPRQTLPPRRERSFEISASPLGAADGVMLPLDEAKARLPDVSWPDTTQLEYIRYYAGDVRVADTEQLLANTERRGFGVAIAGNLVVDGALDAAAGGDGYDSVLVVTGNVFAESAIFRNGIACVVGDLFEVATVILMSHGDDGGYLACERVRAQVLAYSCYFSPPSCELDCFLIGDVYGECAFPPHRSAEVFVPEVLDGGAFDEGELAAALCAGKPVLVGP